MAPFVAQGVNRQCYLPPRAYQSLTPHTPRGYRMIETKRALDLGMHGAGEQRGLGVVMGGGRVTGEAGWEMLRVGSHSRGL